MKCEFVSINQAGCKTKATDALGTTLLHSAASGGNWEIVKKLVDLGCDIKAETKLGKTLLHNAAQVGSVKVLFPLATVKHTLLNSLCRSPRIC